jgi:hypothetical protein
LASPFLLDGRQIPLKREKHSGYQFCKNNICRHFNQKVLSSRAEISTDREVKENEL